MTVDLLVVWLEGSICLRSSTYTDLIKPGFDLCGFSVTPLGYTGVKWDAGDQALQMVVGSSGFAKKKTWWELLTHWEDPICIHLLTEC